MKKWLLLFLLFLSCSAHAGVTADQTTPGYLSTTGCPAGQSSCFLPYSATNPMPITLGSGPITLTAPVNIGTPAITDTGVLLQATSSVAGFNQFIIQNTSTGTSASANYVVNNNLGTATTYYGEFGMNSSTFTGSGAFNKANAVYLDSQSGDLALGTLTANAIHMLVNNSATDALTITATGSVGINNSSPTYPVDVTGVAVSGPYGQVTQRLTSSGSETGLLMANSATGGKQFEFLSTSNASGLGGGKFAIADADNSASRLTITATGTIGIGTGAPVSPLSIAGGGATAVAAQSGTVLDLTATNGVASDLTVSSYAAAANLVMRSASGTSASPTATTSGTVLGDVFWKGYNGSAFTGNTAAISVVAAENYTATSQGSYLLFGTTATGSTTRVNNVAISPAGYLGIGTLATTQPLTVNGNIAASGITFGGTTLAAYAEGTWTPVLTTNGTAGTPAYTTQYGVYTKIGRLVMASFTVTLSGWTGSPTGTQVSMTGLPFTAANTANDYGTCNVIDYTISSLPALNYGIGGYILPNTSSVTFTTFGSSAYNWISATNMGTTPTLIGTCTYHT